MRIKLIGKNKKTTNIENDYYTPPENITKAKDFLYVVIFYVVFGGIFLGSVLYLTRDLIWLIVIPLAFIIAFFLFRLALFLGGKSVNVLEAADIKIDIPNNSLKIVNESNLVFSNTISNLKFYFAKDELIYIYPNEKIKDETGKKTKEELKEEQEKGIPMQNYLISFFESEENYITFSIDEENFEKLNRSLKLEKIVLVEKENTEKFFINNI